MPVTLSDAGPTIRTLREAAGWSLDDLAKAANVDRATINRIELGKVAHPRRETIQSLLRALQQADPVPDTLAAVAADLEQAAASMRDTAVTATKLVTQIESLLCQVRRG